MLPKLVQGKSAQSNSQETVTFDVQGMKCAGCVSAVERQLKQNQGVISACVNLITEVAVVEYEKERVTPDQLAQKLTKTGFPCQPRLNLNSTLQQKLTPFQRRQAEEKAQINRLITAIILLLCSGLGHLQHFGINPIPLISNIWFHWGLATLALGIPGLPILKEGWQGLRQKMPNMNTLVGLGTISAYLASCIALLFPPLGWECFFDEPVMLLGFILLGRILEGKARAKASLALEKLLLLQPPVACLVGKETPDHGINIPVDQIRVGEWVKVLPGEKIPVDGFIIKGQSTVDEAMLTGEAIPVGKKENDLVKTGTINLSGSLIIQTTQTGENTTLAQIINLVESAQTRKAPIQKLADTIAGFFAYGVMAIASVTFLFWYLIGTKIWSEVLTISVNHNLLSHDSMIMTTSPLLLSLKLAIAVLVVACPCALGLATPTAILVGTGIGAQKGILIKGGEILEQIHQLDTIVFDKTGTLTQGHPTLTEIIPLDDLSPQTILQYGATAESNTNHPLAIAMLEAFAKTDLPLLEAQNCQTQAGLGISATIEGKSVILGNQKWLEIHHLPLPPKNLLDQSVGDDQTLVYLAVNGNLKGIIAFSDQIRPDAVKAVKTLETMGLKVIMMTGDRPEVAKAIADKLGIKEVLAQVLPQEKAQQIKLLQDSPFKGKIVAMVGDGINDAPALAQANIGITLKSGTEIALETAQIVLMKNSLWDVVESIKLSLATFDKIRQNLIWALGYNSFAIPVAAGCLLPKFGVLLSPAFAAALMASSSVIVVTNSLLLHQNSKFKINSKIKININ